MGTVVGVEKNSVTFQIGDTLSPPPYPAPTLTAILGNGTLNLAQTLYHHPNLTLNELTETDSGSYVFTAKNTRLDGTVLGTSNGTFTLNVQCNVL